MCSYGHYNYMVITKLGFFQICQEQFGFVLMAYNNLCGLTQYVNLLGC